MNVILLLVIALSARTVLQTLIVVWSICTTNSGRKHALKLLQLLSTFSYPEIK